MKGNRCERHQYPIGTSNCNLCAVELEREEVSKLEAKIEHLEEKLQIFEYEIISTEFFWQTATNLKIK